MPNKMPFFPFSPTPPGTPRPPQDVLGLPTASTTLDWGAALGRAVAPSIAVVGVGGCGREPRAECCDKFSAGQ